MKNPFSAIVSGLRAGLRKADSAISAKRDAELREMTQAVALEALETIGAALPEIAALAAGKPVELQVNVQLQLRRVDEADG